MIMSRLDDTSSYWHFLGGLAAFGLGMALTSTPSTTAIVTSLPQAKQGVASAMNDVSRELGSALGIAILGSLFNSGYRAAVSPATSALPAEAAHAVEESAGAGFAVGVAHGPVRSAGRRRREPRLRGRPARRHDRRRRHRAVAAAFTAWRAPRRADVGQEQVTVADRDVDTSDRELQDVAA